MKISSALVLRVELIRILCNTRLPRIPSKIENRKETEGHLASFWEMDIESSYLTHILNIRVTGVGLSENIFAVFEFVSSIDTVISILVSDTSTNTVNMAYFAGGKSYLECLWECIFHSLYEIQKYQGFFLDYYWNSNFFYVGL